MLIVAVCDDEEETVAALKRNLSRVLDGLRVKSEICAFGSTDALCRKLEAGVRYDLIFLDINFPKSAIDGAEAGRLIREAHNDHGVSIVYVSWEKGRAADLFESGPLDFLLKPLTQEKIERVVKRYMARAGSRSGESFVYKKKRMEIRARIKDIVYFESRGREVLAFFGDGRTDTFYGTLRQIYEGQLKSRGFLFIHASYLVNFDHITGADYSNVYVTGGSTPLPIAQKRRNEIRERYSVMSHGDYDDAGGEGK